MVKNTTGGNKAKGKARKSEVSLKQTTYLRTSDSEFELYAQVTKNLGNGMCHVVCISDGATRLCHIRGKFRGRGKSDNIVKNGSWLLVGLREWEHGGGGGKKLQNCDLLEVYTDLEKEKLKNTVKIDWLLFTDNDNKNTNNEGDLGSFVFTDEKAEEYLKLVEGGLSSSSGNNSKMTTVVVASSANDPTDDDEINVDDI